LTAITLSFAAASCDQPKPYCIVSPSAFAVKLIEKGREGRCEGLGPDGFNADPEVGLAPYYEVDSKKQPDYNKGSLAIQTTEIGTLAETASGYEVKNTASGASLFSLGKFASPKPDDEGVCSVPELSPTRLKLAALPEVKDDPKTADADESFPGQPAQDITLEWSNIKVVVTAVLFGTQIQGDLTDKRVTEDGSTCTIKYRAVGISPAVPCYKTDSDDKPVMKSDGTYETDATKCDPEANPEQMRYSGSGISPLTPTECDAHSGYCVLRGDSVPAYTE
jgi:hypothetical protein